MENQINKIITAFRTYSSQILSDKKNPVTNVKNIGIAKNEADKKKLISSKSSSLKHSINENNKVVVKVIRDQTGKIIRTIPLNEQNTLDVFE